MGNVTESIFGDPIAIYWIAAIFMVTLIGLWWNTRDRKFLKLLAIPICIGAIGYLCDLSVVTDQEQIEHNTDILISAFNKQDQETIFQYLSPSYRGFGRNIHGITKKISKFFKRNKKYVVTLRSISCQVNNTVAETEIIVLVGGPDALMGRQFPMKCKVRWCKIDQDWKICGISKPSVVKF